MAHNHVTVFISSDGQAELEELADLVEGNVDSFDWLGTINGQEVVVRFKLAEEPVDDRDAGDPGALD